MKPTFKSFKASNRDLFTSYNEGILRVIFNEVLYIIKSSSDMHFPMATLIRMVNTRLNEQKIAVLNADVPIRSVMDFLGRHLGIVEDSFNNHADEALKVLWSSLARHINDPVPYIDALFRDITASFAGASIVSTKDAVIFLSSCATYRSIPLDALSDAVEALFDFFVAKGLIKDET